MAANSSKRVVLGGVDREVSAVPVNGPTVPETVVDRRVVHDRPVPNVEVAVPPDVQDGPVPQPTVADVSRRVDSASESERGGSVVVPPVVPESVPVVDRELENAASMVGSDVLEPAEGRAPRSNVRP